MTQLTKKICLIGDFAVGKTSLVRRFIESRFDDRYLSTIGVRVSRKVLTINGNIPNTLTLMVWDTVGGDAFDSMLLNYYRGSGGALLVCDLTRSETLSSLTHYADTFRKVNPDAHFVVIGNKVDLTAQRTVADEQIAATAAAYQAPWFVSSAKTGMHVDTAFETLGSMICGIRSMR